MSIILERFSTDPQTVTPRWPITKVKNNLLNQSDFEESIRSRGEMQEDVCERVMIGFGLTSDWPINWCEFLVIF